MLSHSKIQTSPGRAGSPSRPRGCSARVLHALLSAVPARLTLAASLAVTAPSAFAAATDYGYVLPDGTTPDDAETDALNWLQERTAALPFHVLDKSGVIVAAF